MKIVSYVHHGTEVAVQEHLKGKHREHCLCYQCRRFVPDTPSNCPLAALVYALCVLEGVVLPVWECTYFLGQEE